MKGKTVVITGGTSGIGEIAAERLAQMGARIVLIARTKSRGKVTLARLHEKAPDLAHTVHYADLTRISEMKRVAAEIASQEPRIDVLINNAGAMFASRRLTADGLEYTFALNHMAYFVITEGLRERLLDSAPARIVNTASAAHQGARLDFGDLQSVKSFGAMKAYGRSKLCNILFTRALARRLDGSGVTAVCLHPGVIATKIGEGAGTLAGFGWRLIKPFLTGVGRGAGTSIFLATMPDPTPFHGAYVIGRRAHMPDAPALDDNLAEALWAESARLVGLPA